MKKHLVFQVSTFAGDLELKIHPPKRKMLACGELKEISGVYTLIFFGAIG